MVDDVIRKVVGFLPRSEKLADQGNRIGGLLEARLALRLYSAPSVGKPVPAHGK